jgi:2-polyprenyl-6-methoxyphenol hydroxylase-like FAD-dependent oxidoreductase
VSFFFAHEDHPFHEVTLADHLLWTSYIIPTEQGNIAQGDRLVNWLWYYPVADDSAELRDILTDVHGKTHPNTVSQGLVQPVIWANMKSRFLAQMPAALAEVVDQTPRPFVTKVCEAQCSQSSFHEGRVVLVGDAFTALRSHLGMASEQAATHCAQMDRVWRGEISQAQRDHEARLYAARFLLLNRLVGVFGLEMVWAVVQTAIAYVWLMITVRMGWF